jgi:septal ring factor EnvC (AmiA/AmiB activator)
VNEETKESYLAKLRAQLKEWEAKMEKLHDKTREAEADVKVEYEERIEDLKDKREKMQVKMRELNEVKDEAWEDIKSGLEDSLNEMISALQSVADKFK